MPGDLSGMTHSNRIRTFHSKALPSLSDESGSDICQP